jgi:hypothetical protein
MTPLTHLKQTVLPFLVTIVLSCPGLLSQVQAISPTPDGCYPNFTTAEGCNALNLLTTGAANTALGWRSLVSDSSGSFNTGVGAGALALNNANANTAVGVAALFQNTTGTNNTATGVSALISNSTGNDNTAIGAFALGNNTADGNTAVGKSALAANTTGSLNTVIGASSAINNSIGHDNTGIGVNVLFSNVDGSFNTAVGRAAMGGNTSGTNNTAVGWSALASNATSNGNTATGSHALINSTGNTNTANGALALEGNTTGSNNTAFGASALVANNTGDSNTAVGDSALENNTTGSGNVAVGSFAGFNATTGDSNVYIGTVGGVAGESNTCYIASIFNQPSPTGVQVFVNNNNKLGTATSSKRFKKDIKPMDETSEALFALKPVTFHYKKEIDPAGRSQFGLVAEEVEKVNPDLIVPDKEGKPYAVRYDQVNAMLLNEFLKEHKAFVRDQIKVQELEAKAAAQENEIKVLAATVKEQATHIQKVSAQLELRKPSSQTVLNDQ